MDTIDLTELDEANVEITELDEDDYSNNTKMITKPQNDKKLEFLGSLRLIPRIPRISR